MAKLTRPTETKIFGSTALAAELTPFGSSIPSTDINLILNSIEAQRGWGTIGANGFPPMEWFNALGYGLSYYNAYLMQQGIPEWTALQNYYINSYAVGSDGKLYRSKTGISGTPNAGNNPTTDTTNVNWVESIKADFPAVINGATAKTTPVDEDLFGLVDSAASFVLKKVTWANIKTALTSLFAPLNSPAFTGIPTAPTAVAGTNTTQIATTAGVIAQIPASLNATGTAPIYACRAWVNFNGTGTVAIRASGNVSSITDNGVGDYTVNFTTAMPDVNYCVSLATKGTGIAEEHVSPIHTTSQLNVACFNTSTGALADSDTVSVSILR